MSTQGDPPAAAPPPPAAPAPASSPEILRLETRILEAERRFIPAILNYIEARKTLASADPRRRAARTALLWCLFPFNNAASAAGFLGLILTIITVSLAYQANGLIQRELAEIERQNQVTRDQLALSQEQFKLQQEQFDRQRQVDAERRRSELLGILHARKDCPQDQLRRCPFVADAQTRVYALAELSSLSESLSRTDSSGYEAIFAVDLSDTVFPPRVHLQGLDLGNLDLSHSYLVDAELTDLRATTQARLRGARVYESKLTDVLLPNADLRDARFAGTDLKGVLLLGAQLDGASFARSKRTSASPVLEKVSFERASLVGVNFSAAELRDCTFAGADLTGAVFAGDLPDELVTALAAAKRCPDGAFAGGSCVGKMTPSRSPGADQEIVEGFVHTVAADLMRDPTRVAPRGARWSVVVDIAHPTGPGRLDLHVVQSTLQPEQLLALREVLDSHARRFTNAFSPRMIERIVVTAEQALITVDLADASGSYRRAGCMDVELVDTKGIAVKGMNVECTADHRCTVEWENKEDLGLALCDWTDEQADERLEETTHAGRHAVLIQGLGARTLLHALGLRRGDIVQTRRPGDVLKLRQARLWAEAGRTPATESTEYELDVTRGGRTSPWTIAVVGRLVP